MLTKRVLEGPDIRLVPLGEDVIDSMQALGNDSDVVRFTYVSPPFGREEAAGWVARYTEGWTDGSKAGFSIQSHDGEFLGMAGMIKLELEAKQGEISVAVALRAGYSYEGTMRSTHFKEGRRCDLALYSRLATDSVPV
jgi:RimJ/RimL family protein N-acetyltransferase